MMFFFPTGSARERAVFKSALKRVNSGDNGDSREEPLKVEMKFEQVKAQRPRGNVELYNARQ